MLAKCVMRGSGWRVYRVGPSETIHVGHDGASVKWELKVWHFVEGRVDVVAISRSYASLRLQRAMP